MADGNNAFHAIVVGTGISGGWAARELTEKGLKTLVLDRRRMLKHGEYPTAMEPRLPTFPDRPLPEWQSVRIRMRIALRPSLLIASEI